MECRAGQNQQGIIEQMQKGHQGITKSTKCRKISMYLHKKHKEQTDRSMSTPFHGFLWKEQTRFDFHFVLCRGRNPTSHVALEVALQTKPNLLLLTEEVRDATDENQRHPKRIIRRIIQDLCFKRDDVNMF